MVKGSRRNFLGRLWIGLGFVAFLQFIAGVVLFLRSGRRQTSERKEQRIEAGIIADFPPGSVTFIAAGHLYLSRLEDGGFLAISRKCTHLGCAVPWVAEREQFECPCHASIFDRTGNVIKSPAPRALDLHPLSFEGDRVIIDLSRSVRRSGFSSEQAVNPQGRS